MSGADRTEGCVFCEASAEAALVVFRGATCYVILNLYPYNNGHLMIVPKRHIDSLAAASADERGELMELARWAELALGEAYHPHGMNMGINLGRAGGAGIVDHVHLHVVGGRAELGIVDHVHLHVVPRWESDRNFMTVVERGSRGNSGRVARADRRQAQAIRTSRRSWQPRGRQVSGRSRARWQPVVK